MPATRPLLRSILKYMIPRANVIGQLCRHFPELEIVGSPKIPPLHPAIREPLAKFISAAGVRREGLETISTRKPLSTAELARLMEGQSAHHRNTKGVPLNLPALLHATRQTRHYYHGANLLSYLMARELGWILKDDLNWLMVDHFKVKWFCDYIFGFHLTGSPEYALTYGIRPAESPASDWQPYLLHHLFAGKNVPTLRSCLRTHVVLRVDLRVYQTQIPRAGKVFHYLDSSRADLGDEVIAPILATDEGRFACRPVALVRDPHANEDAPVKFLYRDYMDRPFRYEI